MKKLLAFLTFIVLAMVTAGLFGALHDQVSYSVSREYFTRFKFSQFQLLNPAVPERVRAAEVADCPASYTLERSESSPSWRGRCSSSLHSPLSSRSPVRRRSKERQDFYEHPRQL